MLDFKKYEQLVDAFEKLMTESREISEARLGPDKWTLKEMVGHLIDSASNNHQRFVRLQIDRKITLPGYEAEQWVGVSNIQRLNYEFVVGFWRMYNDYLMNLIKGIEPESMKNVWVPVDEEMSLEFLIDDYFAHMEMHYEMFIERKQEIETSK